MKPVILGFVAGFVGLASAATAMAQAPARIPQQIVINGQSASGAYVLTPSGGIQNYTCPSPQVYSTPDGATQGWACQESTGAWLLGALPPQTAAQPIAVPQPPPPPVYQAPPQVVYQAPPPVVYQPAPQVVYQPAPQVVYQPAPQVVYVTAPPQVIYSQPAPIVYTVAPRPRTVIVNAYPSNTIIQAATIQAAGRVVAAAVGRPRTIEVIEPRRAHRR